jgi:MraZ protein
MSGDRPSMSTYYGSEQYLIDDKGRLAIPAQARRSAGKSTTFLLVPGFEGCLALYNEAEWARVEERLQQLSGKRMDRAFKRALLMNAKRVTVDAQGRITIPSPLLGRAGIGREAVLLGQGTHIEIWEPQRLKAVLGEAETNFESVAEEVLK